MKDSITTYRFCGRKIGIITWGVYRKVVVDADPIEVITAAEGEEFIRIDGSKVRAKEVEPGVIQPGSEWVYRAHRKTCAVDP